MNEEEIYIVHSKLEKIPKIPECCKKAVFRRNKISEMLINECNALEDLDLYDNMINRIENLEKIPNLKILDLSFNLIEKNIIPRLNNLKELYLIGNDINEIGNMVLPNLEKLDMAENNLSKIENLENLPSLRELYLGSNNITKIENLKHLENLDVLDLQNNNLEHVDCLEIPTSVKTLILNENPRLCTISNLFMLKNIDLIAINKTRLNSKDIPELCKAEIWE